MVDNKSNDIIVKVTDSICKFIEPENFQKYILGTTKKGHQRSLYDVIKEENKDKGNKKKKNKKKKKKKNKKKDYKFNGFYGY